MMPIKRYPIVDSNIFESNVTIFFGLMLIMSTRWKSASVFSQNPWLFWPTIKYR